MVKLQATLSSAKEHQRDIKKNRVRPALDEVSQRNLDVLPSTSVANPSLLQEKPMHFVNRRVTSRMTPYELLHERRQRHRLVSSSLWNTSTSIHEHATEKKSEYAGGLLSYIPDSVLVHLIHAAKREKQAWTIESLKVPVSFRGVLQIIDISGYSKASTEYHDAEQVAMTKKSLETPRPLSSPSNLSRRGSALKNKGGTNSTQAMDLVKGAGDEKLFAGVNVIFKFIIPIIQEFGGDVVKFAGDALIVVYNWQAIGNDDAKDDAFRKACIRASICSQKLIEVVKQQSANSSSNTKTDVHIGMTSGTLYSTVVGGVLNRWEYIVSGKPFDEISAVLDVAQANECVVTSDFYQMLMEQKLARVKAEQLNAHAYRLISYSTGEDLGRQHDFSRASPEDRLLGIVGQMHDCPVETSQKMALTSTTLTKFAENFIPKTLLYTLCSTTSLNSTGQLLKVTVLFIQIHGLSQHAAANSDDNDQSSSSQPTRMLATLQDISHTIVTSIYQYDGFVRQICVDDKGTVAIGVFSTPQAGVSASLLMDGALREYNEKALHQYRTREQERPLLEGAPGPTFEPILMSMGVATGTAFCTSLGNSKRCEYSVVGDTPVVAARLMGFGSKQIPDIRPKYIQSLERDASIELDRTRCPIHCDEETQKASGGFITFQSVGFKKIKGKSSLIEVFSPYSTQQRIMSMAVHDTECFIGRHQELDSIADVLEILKKNLLDELHIATDDDTDEDGDEVYYTDPSLAKKNCIFIHGEEGSGKTRFLDQVYRTLIDPDQSIVLREAGSKYEYSDPMIIWKSFIEQIIFRVPVEESIQKFFDILEIAHREVSGPDLAVKGSIGEDEGAHPEAHQVSSVSPISDTGIRKLNSTRLSSQTAMDERSVLSSKLSAFISTHPQYSCWMPLLSHIVPGYLRAALPSRMTSRIALAYVEDMISQIIIEVAKYAQKTIVIMLDDFQWVDIQSWSILKHLVSKSGSILSLISTSTTYKITDKSCAALSKEISKMRNCTKMKMERFKSTEIRQLAHTMMNTNFTQIPSQVWQRISDHSLGNPLIAKESLEYMIGANYFVLNEDGLIDYDMNKPIENCLPTSVEDMLSNRLDRLSPQEQLVVKTCSVLGRCWDYELAEYVFPIKDMDFQQLVKSLLKKDIIQQASPEIEDTRINVMRENRRVFKDQRLSKIVTLQTGNDSKSVARSNSHRDSTSDPAPILGATKSRSFMLPSQNLLHSDRGCEESRRPSTTLTGMDETPNAPLDPSLAQRRNSRANRISRNRLSGFFNMLRHKSSVSSIESFPESMDSSGSSETTTNTFSSSGSGEKATNAEEATCAGAFMFTLSLMKDVAYNRIPHVVRREYHKGVAQAIERKYPFNLPMFSPALSHHWGMARFPWQELYYLEQTGLLFLRNLMYSEAEQIFVNLKFYDGSSARAGSLSVPTKDDGGENIVIDITAYQKLEWSYLKACSQYGKGELYPAEITTDEIFSRLETPMSRISSALQHWKESGHVKLDKWWSKMVQKQMSGFPSQLFSTLSDSAQETHLEDMLYVKTMLLKAQIMLTSQHWSHCRAFTTYSHTRAHSTHHALLLSQKRSGTRADFVVPPTPKKKQSSQWMNNPTSRAALQIYHDAWFICARAQAINVEQAEVSILLAWECQKRNDRRLAFSHYQTAIHIAERLYSIKMLVEFHTAFGLSRYCEGDFVQAENLLIHACKLSRQVNDRALEMIAFGKLLDVWLMTGQYYRVEAEILHGLLHVSLDDDSMDAIMMIRGALISLIYRRPYQGMVLINRIILNLGETTPDDLGPREVIQWANVPSVAIPDRFAWMAVSFLEDCHGFPWGGKHEGHVLDTLVSATSALLNLRFMNLPKAVHSLVLALQSLAKCTLEPFTVGSYVQALCLATEVVFTLMFNHEGCPLPSKASPAGKDPILEAYVQAVHQEGSNDAAYECNDSTELIRYWLTDVLEPEFQRVLSFVPLVRTRYRCFCAVQAYVANVSTKKSKTKFITTLKDQVIVQAKAKGLPYEEYLALEFLAWLNPETKVPEEQQQQDNHVEHKPQPKQKEEDSWMKSYEHQAREILSTVRRTGSFSMLRSGQVDRKTSSARLEKVIELMKGGGGGSTTSSVVL